MTQQDPILLAQQELNEAVSDLTFYRGLFYSLDRLKPFEEKVDRLRAAYNAACVAYGSDE